MSKIYKPKIDKLYYMIFIPTLLLVIASCVLSLAAPIALIITLSIAITVILLMISPLLGYAELREDTLFIRYGFYIKREIPYSKIRAIKTERKWYSESMISLKYAMDHLIIKYNSFENTTISLENEAEFIDELLSKSSLIIREK